MRFVLGILVLVTSGCAGGMAAGREPLRVCSDPNNLPFSNDKRQGFENRIADALAQDLGTVVAYTWRAQRRGFIRNTLDADACDVVLGLPLSVATAATTRPYYRSTYVFVTRKSRGLRLRSFDDESLRRLRIGVQLVGNDGASSPPAHALSRRGIVENVVGYSVYGNYTEDNPPSRIVAAVADGAIDVAAVWGPLAGYFAAQQRESLDVSPIVSEVDANLPLAFDISMAVRRTDSVRLAQLNQFIERRRVDIERILDEYRVPRLPFAEARGR